jgi:hypothetical protein
MLKNKGNNPTKRGALKAVDSLLNAVGEMSDEFQRQISARDVHAAGRAAARHAADLVTSLSSPSSPLPAEKLARERLTLCG